MCTPSGSMLPIKSKRAPRFWCWGVAQKRPNLCRAQCDFSGSGVRLRVDGLRSAREISTELARCDILLFARGPLSSRRGSGLAGIACGLPIVAFRGSETAPPLTEAGIVFVPQDDVTSLGDQLSALLLDREMRLSLSAQNRAVFRQWFSWDRIAERWLEALGDEN